MSLRHSCILIAVAGVLASWVFFFERSNPDASESADENLVFPRLTSEAVDSITFRNAARSISLVRTDGRWRLDSPVSYPAEESKIRSLLASMTQWRYRDELHLTSAERETDAYGLETPERSLAFGGKSTWRLFVGDRQGNERTVFVRREEPQRILTVSGEALSVLDQPVDYWRDSRVFPHDAESITNIAWSGERPFELGRPASRPDWNLIAPVPEARLDYPALNLFIQRLSSAGIRSFHPRSDVPVQLPIVFKMAAGVAYPVELLEPDPGQNALYRARIGEDKTEVSLPTDLARTLLDPALSFRSPFLLDQTIRFDRIEVRAEETFVLQRGRQANSWSITEPQPLAAHPRLVERFLIQLAELPIAGFPADGPIRETDYGLDIPIRTLVFHRTGASSEQTDDALRVRFGLRIQGNLMAHRSDEASIYAVPYQAVMQWPDRGWKFRDPKLWRFAAADVAELRLEHPLVAPRVWRRSATGWRVGDQDLATVEAAALEEFLFRLANVAVESWVSREPDEIARHGTGRHGTVTLGFAADSSSSPRQLAFGNLSPHNHRYALGEVDGVPTLFEFPAPLYDQLIGAVGPLPSP